MSAVDERQRDPVVVPAEKVEYTPVPAVAPFPATPSGTTTLRYLTDEPVQAQWFDRDSLTAGATVTGPAIIREALSTTFIAPGQSAEIGLVGEIVITARSQA